MLLECVHWWLYIYLSTFTNNVTWKQGEETLKQKSLITKKGKTLVTQFSKLYEAWCSALRKTPRYSAPYLKHVQTICTS